MKKLLFAILFCNFAFLSFSQDVKFASGREKHDSKPQLFQNVLSKFSFKVSQIDEVMNYHLHQNVEIDLTPGLLFAGSVSSITNDAPGLTTITIQSSEKGGLVLSFSKLVLPNQSIIYRGLVQSKNHSDMLMLEQDAVTGLYNWNKKQVSHLLSD